MFYFHFCFCDSEICTQKVTALRSTPWAHEGRQVKDEEWAEKEEVELCYCNELSAKLLESSGAEMALKSSQLKQRGQVFVCPLRPSFGHKQGNCFWPFLGRDVAVNCQESTLLEAGSISTFGPKGSLVIYHSIHYSWVT